jgi:purine-binding chemotaxis protein CheW
LRANKHAAQIGVDSSTLYAWVRQIDSPLPGVAGGGAPAAPRTLEAFEAELRATRVPTAPGYLRGVVNVRGTAIPVVDLRTKFGLPQTADTQQTRIIVMDLLVDGHQIVVGGQADAVHEVLELEPHEINEPPSLGMRWRTDLILGMGRRNDRFTIILDIEKVFSTEEIAAISAPIDPALL